MGRFTITIQLSSKAEVSEERKFPYWKKDYVKYDTISFRNDMITIKGERIRQLNARTDFYTVKSNFYRETIHALLYFYYTYGQFKLKGISFRAYRETETIKLFQPEIFNTPPSFSFSKAVLNQLFSEDNSEVTARILILMTLSQASVAERFGYAWRAFNAYYSDKISGEKEIAKLREVNRMLLDHSEHFTTSMAEADKFWGSGLSITRSVKIFSDQIRKLDEVKKLKRFKELSEQYHDIDVLRHIREVCKKLGNYIPVYTTNNI